MSSALTTLTEHPVVQAPMAGGPARPELAAAVCEAGGLGSLAAGYKTPEVMHEEIRRLRGMTSRPFGVNLFVPQHGGADRAAVRAYRDRLVPEAARYEAELGDPDKGTDDAYDGKLALLLQDPVPVVSFTFGCPTAEVVGRLRQAGSLTVVTATTVEEALAAQEAGADGVCLQGVEAGGHQSTHVDDPATDGTQGRGLGVLTLLAQAREAVRLPLIASGGLMRGGQVAAALAAGACAAQLGTAFLVCPESGANDLHKQAVTDPAFTHTELTRAFSGRPARGLVNRFLREHGPHAPAAYPQLHHLTSPLRKAAARAGDPQGMALWAGQGHRQARPLPAAELVGVLVAELAEARRA
jgi:nitronate monooxygenase